jgi:hypothetical protein
LLKKKKKKKRKTERKSKEYNITRMCKVYKMDKMFHLPTSR